MRPLSYYTLSNNDLLGLMGCDDETVINEEVDISGGLSFDDDLGVVYLKDVNNTVSAVMTIDSFNQWREDCE